MGTALKKWVDTGKAQDRIIISGAAEGNAARTRSLCLCPQVATYTGADTTNDAANFACNTPQRVFPAMKKDLVIKDGETLTLGDTIMKFYVTPGHTPGVTSLEFQAVDAGGDTKRRCSAELA